MVWERRQEGRDWRGSLCQSNKSGGNSHLRGLKLPSCVTYHDPSAYLGAVMKEDVTSLEERNLEDSPYERRDLALWEPAGKERKTEWVAKTHLDWVGVPGSPSPFLDLSLNSTFAHMGKRLSFRLPLGSGPYEASRHSSNQEVLNNLSIYQNVIVLLKQFHLEWFESSWIYSKLAMIDADLYSFSRCRAFCWHIPLNHRPFQNRKPESIHFNWLA